MKLWKLKTQGQLSSWEYFKRLQENSISPSIGIPTILQFCLPPEITICNRILYYIGNSKFISDKNSFKRKIICEIQKVIFSKHKILHLANSRPTKFSNSLFSPKLPSLLYASNSKLISFCPNSCITILNNIIQFHMLMEDKFLYNLKTAQILGGV